MRDVCLFAHFDKDDRVDEYVLRYLCKLKELNFSTIFISAARLSRGEVERLSIHCNDVILRENAGLDFGSWSAGFDKHAAAINGRLLLANDSVYGPIGSLLNALDRLTAMPADFYGMVENAQIAPHLQSWFLLLEPWVVRSAAFRAILAQPFCAMDKDEIIARGEIGLTCRLLAAGFRYQALHRAQQYALAGRLHPVNPTHLLWRELLCDEGVPFLKVELLRANPLSIEDAAAILKLVKQIDPAICPLIESHLARTANAAPRRRPPRFRYHLWMLRKDYHFMREHRWAAATWNTVKLEALMLPLWPWRFFRKTVSSLAGCLSRDRR